MTDIKPSEILFILPPPSPISSAPLKHEYTVYTLQEQTPPSPSSSPSPSKSPPPSPFTLTLTPLPSLLPPLFQYLIPRTPGVQTHTPDGSSSRERLVLPRYLSRESDIYVVASTRSGRGLAVRFFDDVLVHVFRGLGVRGGGVAGTECFVRGGGGGRRVGSRVGSRGGEDREEAGDGWVGDGVKEGGAGSTGDGERTGSYDLTITSHTRSIQDFARTELSTSTAEGRQKTVILLSGDGGVVDLLNHIPSASTTTTFGDGEEGRKRITLALLPMGTGNALFHSIHQPFYRDEGGGEPSALVLAVRTLVMGHRKKLPAFRAGFSSGARMVVPVHYEWRDEDVEREGDVADGNTKNTDDGEDTKQDGDNDAPSLTPIPTSALLGTIVASHALHATLVHESDTPALRKHGAKRFGMAAAKLLKEDHVYNASISYIPVDHPAGVEPGGEWITLPSKEHSYILATQVSNLEKTFMISPASRPLDGRMWLLRMGRARREEIMGVMREAYQGGRHVRVPSDYDNTTSDGDGRGREHGSERGEEEDEGGVEVTYIPVSKLKISLLPPTSNSTEEDDKDARWRHVCIDGTIVRLEKGGWMEVESGVESGIYVLVPGGAVEGVGVVALSGGEEGSEEAIAADGDDDDGDTVARGTENGKEDEQREDVPVVAGGGESIASRLWERWKRIVLR